MSETGTLGAVERSTLVDAPRAPSLAGASAAVLERVRKQTPCPVLAAPCPGLAPGDEDELAQLAVRELKRLGVDFGDVRLGHDLDRTVHTRDACVAMHELSDSSGIGVRALAGGFWGFAATSTLTPAGVRGAVARAVTMARALAATTPRELGVDLAKFAAEPPHRATFHTGVGISPFTATVEDMALPLTAAGAAGLAVAGIKRAQGFVTAHGRRRLFASTEGAHILTTHAVVDAQLRFFAVDAGTSAYRTLIAPGFAGGLEHLQAHDFPGQAPGAAREASAKCRAPVPTPGDYTLILDGHHLALTMHESIGHPTELDRVLGYELAFAGGSYASVESLRQLQVGSPLVNFTADNGIRFGGASVGFDDEGVACQSFPVVREGRLVGMGTNRETAHAIGATRANGTCRATHWFDAPIVRIPNLFLEPGRTPLSLEQLVEDTEDGILMLGRDSFSIDQRRLNFQFGADLCYRVRKGRVEEPLRDVIYQSVTPRFWGALDAVCDASAWQMHGVFNCGKGQPTQLAKMMHGAAPARFRGIRVGF